MLGNYKKVLSYVAGLYVDAINIIHYMHDKYAYGASQMALHDTQVERLTAFGVAGLSVAADSLSAIKFAKVRPIRNEDGIAVDFVTEGDFPKYGNDNDLVDDIAVELVSYFSAELKKHDIYRRGIHTLSALTITSNVMYGKKTGSTPDGRKAWRAPGSGRQSHAWPGYSRCAGVPEFCGEDPLPQCLPGRHFQYFLHCSRTPWAATRSSAWQTWLPFWTDTLPRVPTIST